MPKNEPIITDNATAAAAEIAAEIPSTISINGVDYDPAQVEADINYAKSTRELETKYNTSFDKVWPEYGKSQETLKQKETELQQARAEIAEFQSKQNRGTETPTDVKEAQEAARKLGIVLDEDIEKRGYIKKDDLDSYLNERETRNNAIKQVLDRADGLEKEIDGADGRPAFNKKVVLAYASAYNIPDLKAAYEDMNKSQLDTWKSQQVDSKRNPGLKTLSGGGKKEAERTPVTDDNVKDRLSEALFGSGGE